MSAVKAEIQKCLDEIPEPLCLPGEPSRLLGDPPLARWPSPREGDDRRSGVDPRSALAASLSACAPAAGAPSLRPGDGERVAPLSLELDRERERVLDGDLLAGGGANRS